MKVKARKLLSLLLTLAMVVGMFVLPASAADNTMTGAETVEYFTVGSGMETDTKQSASFSDLGSLKSSWKASGGTKSSNPGRYISFKTSAAATAKIWWYSKKAPVLASEADSTTAATGVTTSGTGSAAAGITTYTITSAGTYYIACAEAFRIFKVVVTEEELGDETTSAPPKFADGGDKCTLTEGGNTATFTLKDAVTASTVYKLYDAATDGTLKATSDAVTSGTTVTFSGVTAGTYYMSATEGTKTESSRVAVTVKAFGSVESVKITTAASDLEVGKTLALESTVTPAGGAVEWSSDNENVATVENGTVTAVKVGTANITLAAANDDTVKDSVKVAVKAAKMNGTYTLIAGDLGYGGTKVTPTEDLVYDAGNYFTLKKGISIDGSAEQTFGTEGDAWYYAAPMARINLGSSGNETKNSIVFSTTADNSTVEIWWVQNAASDGTIRELSLDTTKVSTLTVDGATEGALEKNGAYHVTVSNVAKGSHTISSAGGTNYIYKVVVTEGATEQPGDDTLTDITPSPK